jgi:hypothetical protein
MALRQLQRSYHKRRSDSRVGSDCWDLTMVSYAALLLIRQCVLQAKPPC